ncbi:MAG: hypothetical protein AMXMBFR33_12500 [Candidatus Xenobia bacterium]
MSYQICVRCVMDTTDRDITFDEQGICNYCHHVDTMRAKLPTTQAEADERVARLVNRIKRDGRGRRYDCVLGISGGVDSAFTAHLARVHGLRPLVVHLDNGWNSEVAVTNIKNILEKCNFDLHSLVINWEEFRDLQRAFLKASVLDIELLTDHAQFATNFRVARKYNIRYSLAGNNTATESHMPPSWNWIKSDLRNLRGIHRKFGTVRLRTFPQMSFFSYLLSRRLAFWCRPVYLLDNMLYRRDMALETLNREYGFRSYGYKHYESIFTKFYQGYVLPRKWGIDKRRIHFSSLINNQEITREAALETLQSPPYDSEELKIDRPFVLKKLGFSEGEFEAIMQTPPVPHETYASDIKLYRMIRNAKLRLLGSG